MFELGSSCLRFR